MKIPITFKLANRTWRVQYIRMRGDHGRTKFDDCIIQLNTKLRRTPELLLHTFLHELLHATSGTMGWSRVNDDEDRIDALAGLIHQVIATAEGELQ